MEAECKKEAERVEAESTETERVEAECKKEAERVEAESTETERVEAESTETERVEAECKKDAEMVDAESTEGCLHGGECTNTVCPESWKGYDLDKKKYVQSDLSFWVQDNLRVNNAQQENNIQVTWEQRLAQMSSINHFDDLQEYINSNLLPAFEGSVQQDMTGNDKSKLDFVALHHLPQDAPDSFAPISVDGDGNCFPRSVSYILEKHEGRHKEIKLLEEDKDEVLKCKGGNYNGEKRDIVEGECKEAERV